MAFNPKAEPCHGCGNEYDECVCPPSIPPDILDEYLDDPDYWDDEEEEEDDDGEYDEDWDDDLDEYDIREEMDREDLAPLYPGTDWGEND